MSGEPLPAAVSNSLRQFLKADKTYRDAVARSNAVAQQVKDAIAAVCTERSQLTKDLIDSKMKLPVAVVEGDMVVIITHDGDLVEAKALSASSF